MCQIVFPAIESTFHAADPEIPLCILTSGAALVLESLGLPIAAELTPATDKEGLTNL